MTKREYCKLKGLHTYRAAFNSNEELDDEFKNIIDALVDIRKEIGKGKQPSMIKRIKNNFLKRRWMRKCKKNYCTTCPHYEEDENGIGDCKLTRKYGIYG